MKIQMKNLLASFIILFSSFLYPQSNNPFNTFSNFKFGLSAGVNLTPIPGLSTAIIGKTSLTPDFNLFLSAGFSNINKETDELVNTYGYSETSNNYATYSYERNEINYYVFPIAIGAEYYLTQNLFSPYFIFDLGYNFYYFNTTTCNHHYGKDGYYNSYNELPDQSKNEPPSIAKDNSYRISVGAGTTYKLGSILNLDLTVMYQYNKSIENTTQILAGLNF